MKQIVIEIDERYLEIIQASVASGNDFKPFVLIANGKPLETVTEFADRCKECGAKYGKLLEQVPRQKIAVIDEWANRPLRINDECKEESDDEKEMSDEVKYVIFQTYSSSDFCEYGKCPVCGKIVRGGSIANPTYYQTICPKCGQKLRWN